MLISVAFLQSICVLSFRLAHEKQYHKSVKVFNIKHFSSFLKKDVLTFSKFIGKPINMPEDFNIKLLSNFQEICTSPVLLLVFSHFDLKASQSSTCQFLVYIQKIFTQNFFRRWKSIQIIS